MAHRSARRTERNPQLSSIGGINAAAHAALEIAPPNNDF
jgi:hypothetical protein